eukprot:gene4594-7976_t
MSSVREFKVLLIGDGGVGKTTFIKRQLTGEFEKIYIATCSIDQYSITFTTNKGNIKLVFSDTPGNEKFQPEGGFSFLSMNDYDAVMIMIDVWSIKNSKKYLNIANEYCPSVPIVVSVNKVDLDNKIKIEQQDTIVLSCLKNYNMDKPIIKLLRKICNDKDLKLVEGYIPPFIPEMNSELIDQYQKELELALAITLPEEDDDF